MLPHSLATLNLLRLSRINPKLSAYAQLQGVYGYNAQPLAPPGIKIIVHENPETIKVGDTGEYMTGT